MELSLIKRETTGPNDTDMKEQTNVIKYEIMDGAPVKGIHIFF
jgi:vacuolar protein sorting-associated protein 26